MLKKLILAFSYLLLGCLAGLLLLEAVFRVNTGLLIRGMELPAPINTPVTSYAYTVRESDGAIVHRFPDLIRPISPSEDQVVAQVNFETDDFGFTNPAPLPEKVDVVVLGRSYSQGVDASDPWVRLISRQTGLKVLNLSQVGSNINIKQGYLQKYALPRRPHWIILETMPSLDIVSYLPEPRSIVTVLPFFVIPALQQQLKKPASLSPTADAIYPLPVLIGGRTEHLVFYPNYLAALSLDRQQLENSRQWSDFIERVIAMQQTARLQGACLVIFYAPSKENIYFPLAQQPSQLEPVLRGFQPWKLNSSRSLIQDASLPIDIPQMQANANAARGLLSDFARQQRILLIDPTEALTRAALAGDPPFLTYDAHLSATGHRLVAQEIAHLIETTPCP